MATTKLSTDVIDLSGNTEALTIPKGPTNGIASIEYLVVAGGGGGGFDDSGGGGAGGLLTNYNGTLLDVSLNSNLTLIVGAGGTGAQATPTKGGDSTFYNVISNGGGAGLSAGSQAGGSGSGGSGNTANNDPGGAGDTGQGFAGGTGFSRNPSGYPGGQNEAGGGGGGAAALGSNATASTGGAGGVGLQVNIDGLNNFYAGGGGGGGRTTGGAGGTGGGAAGTGAANPSPATANTGGGGGTAGDNSGSYTGSNGGSGVVILRYPTANPITISAGLTSSTPIIIGTDTVVIFTAGTGTVSFGGTGGIGRPSSPTEGLMRENTTTGKMEFYDGSLWQEITDTASTYVSGFIPSANFNTVLYTGTSSTPTVITGVGFKPDFTWLKVTNNAWPHGLFSSQMPVYAPTGGHEFMYSNTTDASTALWGSLQFDNDGWSGLGGSYNGTFAHDFGASGYNYVSWNWKAGGAAVTNSVGTNANSSEVSANVAAGFSIVKVQADGTNNTIGHGLGGVPELIISKNTGVTGAWGVYSAPTGIGHYMYLNQSSAVNPTFDGSVYPSVSSTTFAPGSGGWNYTNGNNYIHYLWRSIPGYSKIGFYVGNGSTTGPEIYTGFKPAWLMTKPTTSGYWYILDNKRNTSNPRNTGLFPNDYIAEITNTNYNVDFNNTGFQPKNNTIGFNNLGITYIYMTFAE